MTMQIILGKEHAESIGEKYIVLELDTFKMQDKYVPSYCILDAGAIPLSEMQELPLWQENQLKSEKLGKDWDWAQVK